MISDQSQIELQVLLQHSPDVNKDSNFFSNKYLPHIDMLAQYVTKRRAPAA